MMNSKIALAVTAFLAFTIHEGQGLALFVNPMVFQRRQDSHFQQGYQLSRQGKQISMFIFRIHTESTLFSQLYEFQPNLFPVPYLRNHLNGFYLHPAFLCPS